MQTNPLTPLLFPVKYKERKRISFPVLCGTVYLALATSGCSSLLAPSPAASPVTVTLTIATRDSLTHAPLPAMRAYTGLLSCVTDSTGECKLTVPHDETVTVAVWGEGYTGSLYTGLVVAPERWTFYLQGE